MNVLHPSKSYTFSLEYLLKSLEIDRIVNALKMSNNYIVWEYHTMIVGELG
jgi:hypothetical protein